MASRVRWTLAALLVGVLGCGDPSGPAQIPLSIYVTESFERDFCEIELDGTSVFAGAVTTASLSTPAASIHVSGPRGVHRLGLRISGQSIASEFVLDRATYVIVKRDGVVGPLRVEVTHEQPFWD